MGMRAGGTFTRLPICSGRTTSASGYVPGGTHPLADVFPRNKSAAEQLRYDTGVTPLLLKSLPKPYIHP